MDPIIHASSTIYQRVDGFLRYRSFKQYQTLKLIQLWAYLSHWQSSHGRVGVDICKLLLSRVLQIQFSRVSQFATEALSQGTPRLDFF